MNYANKPAGLTLAEALGIELPDNAPGGQRLNTLIAEGAQRSTSRRWNDNEGEFDD